MDIADWLRTLGLERYEATFRENGVTAELLCHLTAEDLKELGVAGVGHRRQLMEAIATLNEHRPTDIVSPRSPLGTARRRCGAARWRTPAAHRDVLRPCGVHRAVRKARP